MSQFIELAAFVEMELATPHFNTELISATLGTERTVASFMDVQPEYMEAINTLLTGDASDRIERWIGPACSTLNGEHCSMAYSDASNRFVLIGLVSEKVNMIMVGFDDVIVLTHSCLQVTYSYLDSNWSELGVPDYVS